MKNKVDAKWIKGPNDELAIRQGCYVDEAKGERVANFCKKFLRHSIGDWAGLPFELQPWQYEELVSPLFSWVKEDPKTGKIVRRHRSCYVEIGKKNGKSSLCAALTLFLLMMDNEPSAEIYGAAADRDQAKIVFNEARRMAEASPELIKRLTITGSKNLIEYADKKSYYKVLSKEAGTKAGLNIHGLIFDELMAQKSRELFDYLRFGGKARSQPLLISITTAGYDRTSICWEQHDYTQRVLTGLVDDTSHYGLIKAADPLEDWTLPQAWYKANPSLGVIQSEESFAQECMQAQAIPTLESRFKRDCLCIWTENSVRWISSEQWMLCKDDYSEEDLLGRTCFCSVDLGSTDDLAACCLVFPSDDGQTFKTLSYFWCSKENANLKDQKRKTTYEQWAKEGYLKIAGDKATDFGVIKQDILELAKKFNIQLVVVDAHNARQFSRGLEEEGLIVEHHGQSYSHMNEPTKKLERLVLEESIQHNGNPVQNFCLGNTIVDMDPIGNIRPNKKKSADKIDGIVALIMALNAASKEEKMNWQVMTT